MRLGGFVIHGNDVATLGGCLEDLAAVCDEVVAVDSCSTDGSSVVMDSTKKTRRFVKTWAGYGAARAEAMRHLGACDYVLFLDSDERLDPAAGPVLEAWKASGPTAPYYRVPRRDWVEADGRRYLFRTERRKRLVRRDVALWAPSMFVHEALPSRPGGSALDVAVDHLFATSLDRRRDKERRYALLWALQAHADGRASRLGGASQLAHLLRNALGKGALWRGGLHAARLSWIVAENHRLKYELLDRVRAGEFADLARLVAEERWEELFAAV